LTIWTESNGTMIDIEPKSLKGISQFEHFAECILGKKTPISSAEDGVRMMKILDAIYASSESKREVIIKWD
ncbi:MAG: hypothetical protein QG588_296, partial [Candidatus Poribacteria bacterium]|nr:hypothetical protein [Candidatus Poribacteria bacterium]